MSNLFEDLDWDRIQEKLIEEYPALTEDDFDYENKDEQMIHLEEKMGKTKKEVRAIIRNI